jgi:hypothetical protein
MRKIAADALTRRILSAVGGPARKAFRGGLTTGEQRKTWSKALTSLAYTRPDMAPLVNQLRAPGARHREWLISGAGEKYRAHPTPGSLARMRDAMITQASGRHAPRAGEILLPAAGPRTRVFSPDRPKGQFLFRGNAPKSGPDKFFATRHPEVAANYATLGEATRADGRLFVLDKRRLRRHGEAAPGNDPTYDMAPNYVADILRGRGAAVHEALVGRAATGRKSLARNFEDIVAPRGRRDPVVGEYGVRRTRVTSGPDKGMPAFGLTHVRGVPPSALNLPTSYT